MPRATLGSFVLIALMGISACSSPNLAPNADPATDSITTAAVTPTPKATPTPKPTATPTSEPTATPTPEPYALMLSLVNSERVARGVSEVTMGSNRAAQIHADNSLANCISSHYSTDGLNADMRYSLAGGYQASTETVLGSDYCKRPFQGYSTISSIAEEVRKAMSSWMESPSHADAILKPRHRKVNIGLAWDLYNFKAVLQFEGDHVEYTQLPSINDGILSMEGNTKNGANIKHGDYYRVTVLYYKPPRKLTQGQIARTYGACLGQKVAFLSYKSAGTAESTWWDTCPTPYSVPPESLGPASAHEAHQLWKEAQFRREELRQSVPVTVQRVKMSKWEVIGDQFAISADLSDVLERHGAGVYQVILFGVLSGDSEAISEYSIFHDIPRPTGYDSR